MSLYEDKKLYRANPCDVDATPKLRPIGFGLAALATECPCCNGARVLAAALTPAAINLIPGVPAYAGLAVGVLLIGVAAANALAYLTTDNESN